MGTNHGGVNFGRRLPPIGGQYSTPINTLTGDFNFPAGNTTAAARAKSGPITITNCVPSTFAGRKWTPEARTPDLPERGCSVKVLIVNEKYPPYISGGAERSVQILAE